MVAGATAEPITHRNWTDEWVTVRCGACGREDDWPHPELGCPCGTVLRLPVRPPEAAVPGGGLRQGGLPDDGFPVGGLPDRVAETPAAGRDGRGEGGAGRPGAVAPDPAAPPAAPPAGTSGSASGDGVRTDGPAAEAAPGPRLPGSPGSDETGTGSAPRATAPHPGDGRPPTRPPRGSGSDWFGPGPGKERPGSGKDRPGPPAPRAFAERYPAHIPFPPTAPRPAPLRGAFRPVTIRTARDAAAAAAGYLRWLGFRDIVQPEERPASGVDLRAPGLVAQVDPSTRPTGLRAVECLWLNGLSTSAVSVYFSLAGYTPEARARAVEIGLPLFVLDLTGTPQPVNHAADELAAGGA